MLHGTACARYAPCLDLHPLMYIVAGKACCTVPGTEGCVDVAAAAAAVAVVVAVAVAVAVAALDPRHLFQHKLHLGQPLIQRMSGPAGQQGQGKATRALAFIPSAIFAPSCIWRRRLSGIQEG